MKGKKANICTDGEKVWWKNYCTFALIKPVVLNSTMYSSPAHTHNQYFLMNVFDRAVKSLIFVESQPLNTHLFTIPCDGMGSAMNHSTMY
jgi:hypothetical protein